MLSNLKEGGEQNGLENVNEFCQSRLMGREVGDEEIMEPAPHPPPPTSPQANVSHQPPELTEEVKKKTLNVQLSINIGGGDDSDDQVPDTCKWRIRFDFQF